MENQQKSLELYDWGIVVYLPWGKAKRLKLEEITEVKVLPEGENRAVKFYSGGRCAGICLLDGGQFKLVEKYLRRQLADRIGEG